MKPFDCNNRQTLPGKLTANTQNDFVLQFEDIIRHATEPCSIVYVMNSEIPLPRLRGASTAQYIGKTKQSLIARYPKWNIRADTKTFWRRYVHILSKYGPITIDIYPVSNPELSENDFLFAYHQEFMEAPPLNTINFRVSKLSEEQISML